MDPREIPPSPPRFLDILKASYDEEDEERKKTPREFRHNPSSASFKKENGSVVGACLRQLYFRATNESESDPKELTTKLQADFGNGIHNVILERLKKSKLIRLTPEAANKVVVDPLTKEISFRLDGLATYKGELGGLEIKTKQSYAVQKYLKSGSPDESHLLQVLSYFGTNPDLRWFVLLYFARDTAYRGEYHIYRDPSSGNQMVLESITPRIKPRAIRELSWAGIVNRWKELEMSVGKGLVPGRDFKAVLDKDGNVTDKRSKNYVEYKTDFQCMYCSYKTKCWAMPGAAEDSVKIPG